MSTTTDLVNWMKAAGEPSRLRLIALCSERDLSVTDLARAVGQSGPRVSRHLKILCEAGLLDRVRHGQWVHYCLAEGKVPPDSCRACSLRSSGPRACSSAIGNAAPRSAGWFCMRRSPPARASAATSRRSCAASSRGPTRQRLAHRHAAHRASRSRPCDRTQLHRLRAHSARCADGTPAPRIARNAVRGSRDGAAQCAAEHDWRGLHRG